MQHRMNRSNLQVLYKAAFDMCLYQFLFLREEFSKSQIFFLRFSAVKPNYRFLKMYLGFGGDISGTEARVVDPVLYEFVLTTDDVPDKNHNARIWNSSFVELTSENCFFAIEIFLF